MNIGLVKKADIVIIALLLIVSLVLMLPRMKSGSNLTAEIYQRGQKVETVNLSDVEENYEIELDGAVVLVEKGAVSFKEASCPDKLCVKFGKLTHKGDTAVCVPTGAVIGIVGSESKDIDVIAY